MKSPYKNKIRNSLLACGSLLAATNANAQLTWDANNTGAGQTDGAGTWLNANQWWNGAANANWNSGTPDSANIGNGGAGGAITVGTLTAGTINLNNFSGTYTLQGTGTTLTQTGGITIGGSAGNVTIRGTGASPNNLTLSGAGGITMNGSGLLNLSANLKMNYTGSTVINNGVVMLGNAADRSTGNFNLNGGMLTDYYQQAHVFSSGLGTGANQIQIHGNSGFGAGNGTSTWRIGTAGSALAWGSTNFDATTLKFRAEVGDNNGPSIWGQVALDNRIDLGGGSRTVDVYLGSGNIGNSRATINSGIQDTGATGSLTKTGGGMLILGGSTSTWGGNTTVSSGILDMGGTNVANVGGGTARNITVADGAGIRFNTLTNATLNRLAQNSNEIGVLSGGTANSFDFSSTGANLPNAFLGNFASNGAKAEFSGTITFGGANYNLGAKGGSGALGIVGTNKLTGTQGLVVGQTGASGQRVVLAGANDFSGNTVITSGNKLTLGNNLALQNSALNLGSAGGSFALNTTGTITGVSVAASPTLGGLIGSRSLFSAFTSTGGNNEGNLANTAVTGFTLNVGTGKSHTYSGAIGGFGTGAAAGLNGNSSLTKAGVGTQVLTGVSTYAGATNVNQGTLEIGGAGSINNSAVTVNGGTLRYNSSVAYSGALTYTAGTIAGTNLSGSLNNLSIGAGKTISPGNSPGLASTGAQTWAGGGTYLWEINNANGAAGVDQGWDLISGTGLLNITATSGDQFILMLTTLGIDNLAGDAINFDDSTSYNWKIAEFASLTGFAADKFSIDDTTNFSNIFTGEFGVALGDTGSIGGTANQLFLTYTAVIPEPSVVTLLGALGVLLMFRRRR